MVLNLNLKFFLQKQYFWCRNFCTETQLWNEKDLFGVLATIFPLLKFGLVTVWDVCFLGTRGEPYGGVLFWGGFFCGWVRLSEEIFPGTCVLTILIHFPCQFPIASLHHLFASPTATKWPTHPHQEKGCTGRGHFIAVFLCDSI